MKRFFKTLFTPMPSYGRMIDDILTLVSTQFNKGDYTIALVDNKERPSQVLAYTTKDGTTTIISVDAPPNHLESQLEDLL